jgi:hypothetical protein
MPNAILAETSAKTTLTITLASLAASTTAGRQSTMVDNSSTKYPSAIVYCKIKSGTAPTAGGVYEIFLLRGDDPASSTFRTDAAGASDAALTIENAQLLGTIVVTNTLNKTYCAEFDTSPLGPLGPEWGVAIRNNTSQALNATGGDHLIEYVAIYPESQ